VLRMEGREGGREGRREGGMLDRFLRIGEGRSIDDSRSMRPLTRAPTHTHIHTHTHTHTHTSQQTRWCVRRSRPSAPGPPFPRYVSFHYSCMCVDPLLPSTSTSVCFLGSKSAFSLTNPPSLPPSLLSYLPVLHQRRVRGRQ